MRPVGIVGFLCVVFNLAVAAAVLTQIACSKSTPSTTSTTTSSQPAPAAAASAQVGSVSGKAAPGAIVVLEPRGEREFPPGEKPVMDQVSLTFIPGMLLVRTGQPVEFRNSDDTLHNVHVTNIDTKEPAFNVAIPMTEKYQYTFKKDGYYHVGCDIHPAMSAEIFSTAAPFATVAEADGTFSFSDVPTGMYVARSYAAGVKSEREVEIKSGATFQLVSW